MSACNCAGTFADSDGDGVCDANDVCPNGDDTVDTDGDGTPDACDNCNANAADTSCSDGDPCTTGETYDANCNCLGGTFADGDGVCDNNDVLIQTIMLQEHLIMTIILVQQAMFMILLVTAVVL